MGKPLAILVYLHLEGRAVPRDELAELFWPGAPRKRSRASLRQALWLLRKVLGDEVFSSEDPVALSPGVVVTDLDSVLALGESTDVLEVLEELWIGPPFRYFLLPDLPEWERWVDEIRMRAESRVGAVLSTMAEGTIAKGDLPSALELLERATEIQPHRSALWRRWIDVLLDSRSIAEAEQVLGEFRMRFGGDPEEREALESAEARLQGFRRETLPEDSPEPISLAFVGRATEFSRLVRLWREAEAGNARVGVILGEAGIGKTALAAEVLRLAESGSGRILRIKAHEGEDRISWGWAGELARALMQCSGAAGISPGSHRLLGGILPELTNGAGKEAQSPTLAAGPLVDAMHDLASAVSDDGPLVILVDDLQWVDPESRAVLTRVLRKLAGAPVLTLVTCRLGEGDPGVRKVLTSLESLPGAAVVPLGPLSEAEIGEALALLASANDPDELQPLVARLTVASRRGLPPVTWAR